MFYYSIINQTVHRILQPPVINHPNGSQCSCNVTESELSGAMTIDTSDLKKPQIYFVRGLEIWATDLEACQCWQVIIMPVPLGNVFFLVFFNTRKTDNPIKKEGKDLNRHFSKENIQISNKHIEKMLNITHY